MVHALTHDTLDELLIDVSSRQQLTAVLRFGIQAGHLTPDTQLPTERELATRVGLARGTVRAALSELEREGLLSCVQGSGRRVRDLGRHQVDTNTIVLVTVAPGDNEVARRYTGIETFVQLSAMDAIVDAGYRVEGIHPNRLQGDALLGLIQDRPAGIVIIEQAMFSEAGTALVSAARVAGIPVVTNSTHHELADETDRVVTDHVTGCEALANWLLDRGRGRILRLWLDSPVQRHRWLDDRDAGYRRAVRSAGAPDIPLERMFSTWRGDYTYQFPHLAKTALGYLFPYLSGDRKIDAVMCTTDHHSAFVADACARLGVDPNKDLMLVGYDRTRKSPIPEPWTEWRPHATIDKRNGEIGAGMVELLLSRIRGELPASPQRRVISPILVTREEDKR